MGLANQSHQIITIESSDDQTNDEKDNFKTNSLVQKIFEEDESLVCKKCDMDFWYQSELHEHMKKEHFIADPVKWLKDRAKEEFQKELDEKKRKAALNWNEIQRKARLSEKEREERARKIRDEEFRKLQKLHAKKAMAKIANDHADDLIRSEWV